MIVINTVQLVGRLTKEVDLKFTSSGIAVGTFNIAVNRNFKNQQGEQEADFISCVIWRKSAENFANFTRKGSQVGLEGRLQTRNYENQQGQRVYVTEVVVEQFHLLEPRSVTEQRPQGGSQNNSQYSQNQGQGAHNNQGNINNQYQNNSYQNQGFGQNQGYSNSVNGGTPVNVSDDDLPF